MTNPGTDRNNEFWLVVYLIRSVPSLITLTYRLPLFSGEVLRMRLPRCCSGETLPPYSEDTAHGQDSLWRLNQKSPGERFISWCNVNKQERIIISSKRIRLVQRGGGGNKVLAEIAVNTVKQCRHNRSVVFAEEVNKSEKHYLTIEEREDPGLMSLTQRLNFSSRLECSDEKTALKIIQEIHYAIDMRQEAEYCVSKTER